MKIIQFEIKHLHLLFLLIKENYMELMEKVLNAFKPGKFLMTVFANKVTNLETWESPKLS